TDREPRISTPRRRTPAALPIPQARSRHTTASRQSSAPPRDNGAPASAADSAPLPPAEPAVPESLSASAPRPPLTSISFRCVYGIQAGRSSIRFNLFISLNFMGKANSPCQISTGQEFFLEVIHDDRNNRQR